MVLDLFAGSGNTPSGRRSRGHQSNGGRHEASVSISRSGGGRRRGRNVDGETSLTTTNTDEDRQLFTNCVSQVQRNLKAHADSPSTLHTLASYYTQIEPFIEGRPFCVSLSYATFLFHMQMARISVPDVELYVHLITNVLSQLTDEQKVRHPFVQQVLRDHVFGLPSPTCRGAAHCVVLVPPQQYRAFATMSTALLALDIIPMDIVYQFQDKLEHYCNAASPIVANRALALLVQTVGEVRVDEQVTALQYVLRTKPVKMNVDFLLACYERLKRAVLDAAHGPTFGRALSIHCSELFLRLRSPIRREYVERFLYPSLCHPDMAGFLEIQATREHLLKELLHLCTPDMGTTNPYYMCLCSMMQSCFDNEIDGALEAVTLINCQMPHAAYFMSTLAVDSHMSVAMFAKIVIALSRGAGLAMTGREVADEVANTINNSRTSVYNVLFMLREVVRSCSVTASRRATDMLSALRVAVPTTSIEALGKLSSEAFDGRCDITVDPQLLCAELAMVLHHEHIEAAAESAVEYFRSATTQCHFCGMQRSTSLLCPVNGTVHVTGQTSVSRVLSTLAECAGAKVLEERMIRFLRDPATQMDSAVHFLLFHILANAGQHRNTFFVQLEPYIRSTLMALVSADRGASRGLVSSEHKANVLMLHVKTVMLLAAAVDPSYLESLLKVFAELRIRNNHDALALWLMGNLLLRNCKGSIELLPTDPQENNYCVDYPGCAPASATCADNAQLVLRLLDRAHHFSAETRKLVGCCVCKLIQDFNIQAPNIVMTLLSSYGFVPTGLTAVTELGLPVGAGSTFWSFFLQQMKTSAPARTAFMAALAKSISRRFRIASPADAVTPYGVEATGHVFTVMMYEAMKRNPPLARVVLFMVSHWMKQADHQPGKFVCLVYVCVQLVTAVVERGVGAAPVEVEAETSQDRSQFDESTRKAARILKQQQQRLEKLLPAVRHDGNAEFSHLIRRLQRKVRRTVALVNGEISPGTADATEDSTGALDDNNNDDDLRTEDDQVFQPPQPPQQPYNSTIMALRDLQSTADDSVFDTDAMAIRGGSGAEDGLCGDNTDEYDAVGMEGTDTTYRGSHAASNNTHHEASTGSILVRSISTTTANDNRPHPHHHSHGDNDSAASGAPNNSVAPQRTHPSNAPSTNRPGQTSLGEVSSILKKRSDGTAPGARRPTAAYHEDPRDETAAPGDDTGLDGPRLGGGYGEGSHRTPLHSRGDSGSSRPMPRSQSRGVQTDNDDDDDDDSGRGDGPNRSPAVDHRHERESRAAAARGQLTGVPKRSHDKAVTAPFEQSVGTSPIHFDETTSTAQSGGGGSASLLPRTTSGRVSAWQEPDLEAYVQGDTTPIEETGVPRLQSAMATEGGVALPSGMVLEYLRTHQAVDSLRHELDQLDQDVVMREVTEYVQRHSIPANPQPQAVTIEGRANNYTAPHHPPRLVPGRAVVAPITMVSTTPTARRAPQVQQPEQHRVADEEEEEAAEDVQGDVVDGEGPVRAVSETALSKRRRMEQQQQQQQQQQYASGAAVTPTQYLRGRNFFLNRQPLGDGTAAPDGASALQDLHFMQRQHGTMEALLQVQQQEHGRAEDDGLEPDENRPPSASNVRRTVASALASEGLPPTTPYGQVVIPACFVEQKNDTAVRELRQAMGAFNVNEARLSTQGKQRIRGSGGGGGGGGALVAAAPGDTGNESSGSAAWWMEMSTAPMPNYAIDPQYSMELF